MARSCRLHSEINSSSAPYVDDVSDMTRIANPGFRAAACGAQPDPDVAGHWPALRGEEGRMFGSGGMVSGLSKGAATPYSVSVEAEMFHLSSIHQDLLQSLHIRYAQAACICRCVGTTGCHLLVCADRRVETLMLQMRGGGQRLQDTRRENVLIMG